MAPQIATVPTSNWEKSKKSISTYSTSTTTASEKVYVDINSVGNIVTKYEENQSLRFTLNGELAKNNNLNKEKEELKVQLFSSGQKIEELDKRIKELSEKVVKLNKFNRSDIIDIS